MASAASRMSSRSAASRQPAPERSGGINRFRAGQDMPFADIIVAGFDRLAVDKIDPPRQQGFQRLLEIQKAREFGFLRGELDQEIEIAARRVEIAPRRRAEHVEAAHVEAAAQRRQLLAMGRNIGNHRRLLKGEYSTLRMKRPRPSCPSPDLIRGLLRASTS